ncbi:MAG: Mrp/NBP35 family ATP-binding protein [Candidatus Hydrothermarchaeota archaeon]
MVTEDDVKKALSKVMDPELGKDLVTLGMVRDIKVEGSKVAFTVVLTTPACPLAAQIQGAAREAVLGVPGVREAEVRVTAQVRAAGPKQELIPGVKNTIAVGSGKGGVGKSTVAVNVAIALADAGAKVGLLDADIYGPNIPTMMGAHGQPEGSGEKIVPLESYGVKLMSLGFFLGEDTPVIWRGPMVMRAIQQLLGEVEWGELDYLIIDLPPGTGDAQLTISQSIPLTGAVIVTTPQDVALEDAMKGLVMFQRMNIPILGIVENMSYFLCPHCQKSTDIFGHGGGERASKRFGVPFLGEIPLDIKIRVGGDEGRPIVKADPASPHAEAFRKIASALAARVSQLAVKAE